MSTDEWWKSKELEAVAGSGSASTVDRARCSSAGMWQQSGDDRGGMTPARRASLDAHKRRMRAAFFDRPVFCTRCRQWVDRAITHMVSIGNGRGRVECRRHAEGA